jgi:hypothetical protein
MAVRGADEDLIARHAAAGVAAKKSACADALSGRGCGASFHALVRMKVSLCRKTKRVEYAAVNEDVPAAIRALRSRRKKPERPAGSKMKQQARRCPSRGFPLILPSAMARPV